MKAKNLAYLLGWIFGGTCVVLNQVINSRLESSTNMVVVSFLVACVIYSAGRLIVGELKG